VSGELSAMLNIVKQYTPNTWDSYSKTSTLESDTEEYRELRNEVNAMMSTLEIKEILRVQDLQAYGQFLIREQLLLKTETSPLYRVKIILFNGHFLKLSISGAVLCYGEQRVSRQSGEIQPGPKTLWHGVINIELQQKVTVILASFYFEMYKFHDEIPIRT
jgi:hypothetical protein